MVVTVFGVVQPNLSYFGLFPRQRVRQVIEYIEVLAEIPQFLIRLTPHKPIPTQFELLIIGPIHKIGRSHNLFQIAASKLPFWTELLPMFLQIEATKLEMFGRVAKSEQRFLLGHCRRHSYYIGYRKGLPVILQLQHTRYHVEPDIEVYHVPVHCAH